FPCPLDDDECDVGVAIAAGHELLDMVRIVGRANATRRQQKDDPDRQGTGELQIPVPVSHALGPLFSMFVVNTTSLQPGFPFWFTTIKMWPKPSTDTVCGEKTNALKAGTPSPTHTCRSRLPPSGFPRSPP